MTTYCVDFVDKDNARHILFGLLKQTADSACAYAHVHFDKIAAADGKERYARLAGNGFCKQSFTRSRRTYEQNTLGNFCAHLGIFRRIFKKIDNLYEFFLFFLRTGNVAETRFNVLRNACTALADIGRLHVLGADTAYEYDTQTDHQYCHHYVINNGAVVGGNGVFKS